MTATIWSIINSHLRPLGSGRVLRRRGFPANYLFSHCLTQSPADVRCGAGLGDNPKYLASAFKRIFIILEEGVRSFGSGHLASATDWEM